MSELENSNLRDIVVSDVLGIASLSGRNLLRNPEMFDLWLSHLKDLLEITDINIMRTEEKVMHQSMMNHHSALANAQESLNSTNGFRRKILKRISDVEDLKWKYQLKPKVAPTVIPKQPDLLKAEITNLQNQLKQAKDSLKLQEIKIKEKALVFEEILNRTRKNSGIQARKNRLLATAFKCLLFREEGKVQNQEPYDAFILEVLREFNADWQELKEESLENSEKVDREKIRKILAPYLNDHQVGFKAS